MRLIALLTIVAVLCVGMGATTALAGDDFTWIGTTSEWDRVLNWCCGGCADYPRAADDTVTIGTGGTTSPVIDFSGGIEVEWLTCGDFWMSVGEVTTDAEICLRSRLPNCCECVLD